MKNVLILLLTIFTHQVFSQSEPYTIKGKINQNSPNKYAYFHIFSSRETRRVPITQNGFVFKGLKENKDTLMTAAIFLGQDSTETYYDSQINVFNGLIQERKFVIENTTILIDANNIEESTVIGSELNRAYDEMHSAIKTHNYFVYFDNNNNSPVSLLFLLALTGTNRLPLIKQKANIPLYYGLLTDELKHAYLGRKIAKIIDKEYKN